VDIREILIVTGTEHMGDVVNLLGSGRDFECRFTYKVHEEAGGIAQALGLAENFVGDDALTVILADNIFETSLQKAVDRYPGKGAEILLKEVGDRERFGVSEVDGEHIAGSAEKPSRPQSNLAVTGVYMYDARVFDYIYTLPPSDRGELEISAVNNHCITG